MIEKFDWSADLGKNWILRKLRFLLHFINDILSILKFIAIASRSAAFHLVVIDYERDLFVQQRHHQLNIRRRKSECSDLPIHRKLCAGKKQID
jgi:hypothetical protein